jgi:hypothetical protein
MPLYPCHHKDVSRRLRLHPPPPSLVNAQVAARLMMDETTIHIRDVPKILGLCKLGNNVKHKLEC